MHRPQTLQLDLFTHAKQSVLAEADGQPQAPTSAAPAPAATEAVAEPGGTRDTQIPSEPGSDPGLTEENLRLRLNMLMTDRLGSITLTNNRSSIVSARTRGGKLDLRIHRSFAVAPDEALAAVATFLRSKRQSASRRAALAAIRAYFQGHTSTPTPARRLRRIVLRPVGQTYDLRELRDTVNKRYFGDALTVRITWGRAPSRRKRPRNGGFTVRLGTFSERQGVVRIHPCLDDPKVPRYVVESVVHHEMLHAALPPVVVNGRRRIHTPEFRRRERLFSGYQKAERWIERNIGRLIGAR